MEKLSRILLNETEGATQLLLEALRCLDTHPEWLHGDDRRIALQTLRTTRPAMACFARLADELDAGRNITDLHTDVLSAESRIATEFAARIEHREPMRLVSLSWSSTVLAALAMTAKSVSLLAVLESHPGGEGKRLCAAALQAGLTARLYPDAELEPLIKTCTAGVIGADTLFSDGAVLNKVLSLRLARALRAQGLPLYVLASRWKASALRGADYEGPPGDDAALFEVVPAGLVTNLVTEEAGSEA